MYEDVFKNKHGFYELKKKLSESELALFYKEQYYQKAIGGYEESYSVEEKKYFMNRIERCYKVLEKLIEIKSSKKMRFLDVGCGEGWALKYFKNKMWRVTGLDYSEYGCMKNNPECFDDVIVGDVMKSMDILLCDNKKFHCIFLANVLEHVLEPDQLIKKCRQLLLNKGILIVRVPNDFSVIQHYLNKGNYISTNYWIDKTEHLSYFSLDSLITFLDNMKFDCKYHLADYPIEMNLFNENTNYVEDKVKGKSCYLAQVDIENFLNEISVEKTIQLYNILADMGLGRSITAFFAKS